MTTTVSVVPALMAANAANIANRAASQASTCTLSIHPWLGNAMVLLLLVVLVLGILMLSYMAYDMLGD